MWESARREHRPITQTDVHNDEFDETSYNTSLVIKHLVYKYDTKAT